MNDSVRRLQTAIDAKDEVDIASQSWRLRNRLKASREHLNANTVKAIETMLAKTDAFMQQRGLEISDPIGQEFVDGGNEHNVIAWMPPANGEQGTGTGGTITEVTEPGVVRVTGNKRKVLQRGEMIATMHTAEQAAQREATLAQREFDLRARLTETQAAIGAPITPEQDAEYAKAVESGDTETQQRLVDEAARAAGYNETGSHGLASGTLEGDSFDPSRLSSNTGAASARLGYFFGSKDTAATYAFDIDATKARSYAQQFQQLARELLLRVPVEYQDSLIGSFALEMQRGDDAFFPTAEKAADGQPVAKSAGEYYDNLSESAGFLAEDIGGLASTMGESGLQLEEYFVGTWLPQWRQLTETAAGEVRNTEASILSARLQMTNPYVHDYGGQRYRDVSYAEIIKRAKAEGHDSVILKNTYDGAGLDDIKVVFDPSQIKSADPITRDAEGRVIPLSERFNPEQGSILYQAAIPSEQPGDVTFQRPLEQPAFGPSEGVQGSFNLRTLEIMLTKRATWRTAAHEFIHAYWNGFLSISSMENAPPHVLRDIDTVLSWMGIEGATPEERRTKYMSMSLEERRPHEEALAYSGEVYFSEGKAPNEELRGVFERLSQWMLKLYGDIRGKLNDDYRARYGRDLPILTGEVRQVFDRWMAAEDTITHTETMREMKGVWQTREESPLNDAEWADYQEKQQSAHDASVADLNTRSIQVQERIGRLEESTKRGIVAKAKKIRAAVREEIADAVSAEPLYRAMQFLKRGLIRNDKGEDVKSDTVVKLNRDVVVSMIGEDAAAALGGGKYGMLSKDGVHPDVVAEMFGFESGKAFVERLSVAPTFEKAVEFRTDQRMIREHSDLTDPTKIQRAVDEAVHNVARREFVALEFKLLARATEPVKIMAEAARSVAMDRINGMRIKDINQRQHILAESKAARTALDAVQATPPKIDMERIVEKARTAAVAQSLKDGKTEVEAALAGELAAVDARAKAQRRLDAFREKYGDKDPHEVAIRAKRQQLLQSHLATAALDALNEVDAAIDGIRKIFGSDEKIGKTRDFNMVLAARSILAHFGLGRSDKTPAEYLKNVEQFNPSLYADLKPILDRLSAGPQDYRELTMVEFRGVMDAVNALWENARRDKIVMIDGKRVAVADAIGELRARMEEIRPTEAKPISGAASDLDRFMRRANEWKTVWRRVEHWCAAMDGPNGPGPFTKFIWRPIVAAMDAYRADYAKYVERYGDMVRSLKLPSGKIEARELGYTFGNGNGGNGLLELLGAMAHAGNDSNLQKLLRGYGWGHLDADGNLVTTKWDTFVNRMIKEGVLTKEHFDFLQAMWKLNEGLGDLAQRAKYDMDGCYYDKIKTRSFETPWGVYEGGYVPAAVDEYLVSDIETIRSLKQIDADFRSEMPGVAFGFTKSRNEGFAEPLALDLRIIGKHIDSVLRYVHVAPAIKDVTRLLKNKEFASKLNELDPNAINKLIIPMLERAARNSITKPGLDPSVDRFWSTIRRRTSLNFMAANLRQIGHAGGFTAAYVKVDAGQLHSALAQYTMNPSQVATDIAKMSPMMDERLHNQVMDARDRLMDILESRGPVGKTEAWFRNHGMFLSHALHNQMDIIIWLGKFNETMEKLGPEVGMDEAKQEAIHRADAAVRMTQGSAHAEDVARYQTGTPFAQAMFSFTGYLNTIANLNADEFVMSMRDMGIAKGAGRLVYSHIMAYAIPMMVFEAFAKTVSGDWNKKKHDSLLHDVLEFIFASYAHGAVGMIPGGSQIYSGITATTHAVQRVQGGPVPFHGDHIEVAPTIAALENATVGTAEAIARLTSKNKKVTGHNVRDVMTLMSLLTGVPTAPVAKPIGYMMDVNQKKIRPTSTYDYVRGAVSGVGSPASKNQ